MSGQEHETELAPDEPPSRGRDREAQLRLGAEHLARRKQRSLDLSQERRLPLGFAPMRERDDDAVAGADERSEVVLGLREPARGDSGSLRFERVRLPLRERVELGRPVERERGEPFLLGDAAHLVGLPDDVRSTTDGRDEVGRDPREYRSVLVVSQVGLDEVGPPFGRRVDGDVVCGVKRALGEGREGTHLLDLVAEQLDAERFTPRGGEDVDDPAAHGELPALVHPIDTLVPRKGERCGEAVGSRLVADPQLHDGRTRSRGWEPFRKGCDGCADEAPGVEDVKRAIPLAHEMGGRSEAGLVRDATTREERDLVRIAEPARSVGRVACCCVVGEQHEQWAPDLLVERRENQREHGLGHPGACREHPDERGEALVPAELVDEGGERRGSQRASVGGGRVHAFGGDRAPRGHRTRRWPALPTSSAGWAQRERRGDAARTATGTST